MTLSIQNLSKSFQTPQGVISLLNHISLQINAGDTIAIMGPSGSGKTTLLNMIATREPFDSGEIVYPPYTLSQLSEKEKTLFRQEVIGVMNQDPMLLPQLTSIENIELPALAKRQNQTQRALALLDSVGLSERAHHYPHQLSGGERQRVAFARALLLSPPLILADEPTAQLDIENGEKLLQLIQKLHREFKFTMMMSTHNPEAAKYMNRLFEIKAGQLVEKNI